MSDEIIIPQADAVLRPVLERMYLERENSFQHIDLRTGVYWHPMYGFRAQAALLLRRQVELARARKLKTAVGGALLDYVASEFGAVPETEKTFARGTITMVRSGSPLPAGYYPAGTKINRKPFSSLGVDYPGGEYTTEADAVFPLNSTDPVTVPIVASRGTAYFNSPILTQVNDVVTNVTVPSSVTKVSVTDFQVGGGSEGLDDELVRLFAKTYALGEYGPTKDASKLGALAATGVRHFLVYDTVATGTQNVLVADESWGSSSRWASQVKQSMYDSDLVGFGCKVAFARVRNRVIHIRTTIVLRDANYLTDTTEIDIAVQKALRSYFDDRIDWNVWNAAALKSVVARAHSKIFSCSSVVVLDASTGATVSEIVTPDYDQEQVHFYLANNAVTNTYLGPS